jgi:bile acid-coenzyme A ligase
MSMGLALSWQAAQNPDAPALTMGPVTYSRMAVDRAANRLARDLARRGIARSDRVVVLLPTGPRHQIACFAAWKLGATVIPISDRLVDRELRQLVREADPALVIGVDPLRLPGCNGLPPDYEPVATLSDDPLPEVVAPVWKASCSGGSTGIPKLIRENRSCTVHPHEPTPILRLQSGDTMLHPAAAYHNASFTQTNWGLCWGCHVVLMPRFDAVEWLRTVERMRVNWAYMVPTMMSRVLAIPAAERARYDLSSIKMIIHMAAPCPPWVKEAWIDWFGRETIWEVYAGTEGFGATIIGGGEWLEHRGSVGRAPAGTTICDDEGRPLPVGEVGQIYFLPYAGNPMGYPQTPRTYGDMGSLDESGYLYLADRRSDMILTGGVNLYPAEIEGEIEQFPGVVASAVVGLPDADLGARAHAIVQLSEETAEPDVEGLRAFLAERLSPNKLPRSFEFTREGLRDEAGKLRRSKLREARTSH